MFLTPSSGCLDQVPPGQNNGWLTELILRQAAQPHYHSHYQPEVETQSSQLDRELGAGQVQTFLLASVTAGVCLPKPADVKSGVTAAQTSGRCLYGTTENTNVPPPAQVLLQR